MASTPQATKVPFRSTLPGSPQEVPLLTRVPQLARAEKEVSEERGFLRRELTRETEWPRQCSAEHPVEGEEGVCDTGGHVPEA